MKPEEILFCRLIRMALHPEDVSRFTPDDIEAVTRELDAIFTIAKKHNMQLALYDSLCALPISFPTSLKDVMQKTVISYSMGSYQMLAFTRKVLSILSEEKIGYILLKGVSLLACYPKLEFRAYGDVDILIPDRKEFAQVKKRFLAEGFYIKEDFVDHQLELYFTEGERHYLLELHSKVIGSQDDKNLNRKIVELFSSIQGIPNRFVEADLDYFVFPYTENTVYLLLHMLQHFLSSGFGIKLLCDWTVYIETHCQEIDWDSYAELVSSMGLTGFSHAMAQLCVRYFGLPEACIPLSEQHRISDDAMEELMKDILTAGEFGKSDTSRMLIMAKGKNWFSYLQQLHRQMKNRFPRAYKVFLIWPVLWFITGVCFLWNNYTLRKVSTREVLAMTRKRNNLLRELRLFESDKEEKPNESKS